jgi:hypothetical protein
MKVELEVEGKMWLESLETNLKAGLTNSLQWRVRRVKTVELL